MQILLYILLISGAVWLTVGVPSHATDNHSDAQTQAITFKDISISGGMIPHIFHPTKPGIYNNLLTTMTTRNMDNVHIQFQPIRRAQQDFLRRRSDCYFISDKDVKVTFAQNFTINADPNDFIYSDVINQTHIKVYTRTDKPAIQSLSELTSMVVAADPGTGLGYALRTKLPQSTIITATDSVAKSLELLHLERVEAIVAYDIDVAAYYTRMKMENGIHNDNAFNLHTSNDSITCWKTEKNIKFIKKLNIQLANLRTTGELASTLAFK